MHDTPNFNLCTQKMSNVHTIDRKPVVKSRKFAKIETWKGDLLEV